MSYFQEEHKLQVFENNRETSGDMKDETMGNLDIISNYCC
jgi:hypothetical protein